MNRIMQTRNTSLELAPVELSSGIRLAPRAHEVGFPPDGFPHNSVVLYSSVHKGGKKIANVFGKQKTGSAALPRIPEESGVEQTLSHRVDWKEIT